MKALFITLALLLTGLLFTACNFEAGSSQAKGKEPMESGELREAVFAGGCFWCTESDFEKVKGVTDAVSGYTGGHVVNPTYEEVSGGGTGHVESVKVIYDPKIVTYSQLLDVFWRHVNPTDSGGQFVDRGPQYRSVIFYANERQKRLAEKSKEALSASGQFDDPIVTEILPLGPFYKAEEYHQNYYKKNPIRYKFYRFNSGRDQFLEKAWKTDKFGAFSKMEMKNMTEPGEHKRMSVANEEMINHKIKNNIGDHKMNSEQMNDNRVTSEREDPMMSNEKEKAVYKIPDDKQLRRILTPEQYRVTRENGTEPAFHNKYWDNHEPGIYVDVISGEPLFSSMDKFESGTGWPSFTRPLVPDNIVEKTDRGFFMTRT